MNVKIFQAQMYKVFLTVNKIQMMQQKNIYKNKNYQNNSKKLTNLMIAE